MKKLVPIIAVAGLALGGLAFLQMQSAEANKPMLDEAGGKKAPHATLGKAKPFELKRANDGKSVRLADFAGKVVVLDFWATWCPPCRAEIPDFIALQKQYKSQGLEIVGVSVDQQGAPVVNNFAKEHGINYTSLLADDKVVSAYGGIRGIPTTFVIDREGNIVKKYVGQQSKDTFEKDIKALL